MNKTTIDFCAVFDRIAGTLREGGAKTDQKTLTLSALINEFQNLGWQDEYLSLNRFQEDTGVVAAFEENGVDL